jgi:valine--pyruvate aminotransferase
MNSSNPWSVIGRRLTDKTALVELMDDIGSALKANPNMLMLGGGSPARIPVAEALYTQTLQLLLAEEKTAHQLYGRYQGPLGDLSTRQAMANFLHEQYGWAVNAENVAITNGGQSAFGILTNLLAGQNSAGQERRLHFPVLPEYLGYKDVSFRPDAFSGTLPNLELIGSQHFKYRLQLDALPQDESIAAFVVSRPTNPTGNVLTIEELADLDQRAGILQIPLILDAAYGMPLPGLQYQDTSVYFSKNTLLMLSCSKLGLPGLRSGFLIGQPELIEAFSRANTNLNLAPTNVGPMLLEALLRQGKLQQLANDVLRPWYLEHRNFAEELLLRELEGLPIRLHLAEGSFFLWLWAEGLPISTSELYHQLREAGVIVIPGDAAFLDLAPHWQHSRECVRISYAIPQNQMKEAVKIIAKTLRRLASSSHWSLR